MEKMYFEDSDDTKCFCYSLDLFLYEAKYNNKKIISLIEAIPSKNKENIWCNLYGKSVIKCDCRKSECFYYEKSNNNVCINRGKLYDFGRKVTFDVETHEEIDLEKDGYDYGFEKYECINCKKMNWVHKNNLEGNVIGYCDKCGHPIWVEID